MERDECFGAVAEELDVQGGHVCLEGQLRTDPVVAGRIVDRVVYDRGELVANLQAVKLGDVGVPQGEAVRISVVAALVVRRPAVEEAVEVQLLSGVVLVDVGAVPGDLIDRVLHAEDAARGRLLGDADRVSESPAQHRAVVGKVECRVGQGLHVKGADLRHSGVHVPRTVVNVVTAALGHDELVGGGHEQGSGDMPGAAHVLDHRPAVATDGTRIRVIRPRIDIVRGGGKERLVVPGQCDAVVQLAMVRLAAASGREGRFGCSRRCRQPRSWTRRPRDMCAHCP